MKINLNHNERQQVKIMTKFDFNDLSSDGRFIFIASTKVALLLEKKGFSKGEYMVLCEEIWESMKLSDPNELIKLMDSVMKEDVENFLKWRNEHNS